MTEPITAMGQLLDRYAEMRGLLIEALSYLDGSDTCGCGRCKLVSRIDAALARDITTALTAPDIQPHG